MPKNVVGTIVKIVVFSLVIGFILKFLEIRPTDLWQDFGNSLKKAFDWAGDFVAGSVEYILVGAVIVVPIWLVVFLFDKFKKR